MRNRHEKIFKREDGSSAMIEVSMNIYSGLDHSQIFSPSIFHRGKGKRKWIHQPINPWNSLDSEALKIVSEDEVLSAKLEAWESIKPGKP